MKTALLFFCFSLFVDVAAGGQEHPIPKVIGLLQDLSDKVEQEGRTEVISFTAFERWCANSFSTLNKAITVGKEQIDILSGSVESKTKEEQSLVEQISSLEEQIAKHQASGKETAAARAQGAKLYAEADDDFKATIQAIDDALKALEGSKAKVSGALLAQRLVSVPLVIAALSPTQLGMLASSSSRSISGDPVPPADADDVLAKGDYKAHEKKYVFKSGNVVELLKQLKSKFEDDRLEATKAETNAQNAASLSKDARGNALKAAQGSLDTKTSVLADVRSGLIEDKASLLDTRKNLDADSSTMEETQKSCAMKKSEWSDRSKLRQHELEALAAAIKILAKVGGVRTEAPSNPIPPPSPVSAEEGVAFIQMRGTDPKMRAVNLLRKEANTMHSRELEKLAQQVAAHLTGPFDEVNNMIQKMIFRVMAEQKDEDDHKNWCDLELEKTDLSKNNKENKVDALTAKIDAAEAEVNKLMDEINDANKMVADIATHVEEATVIRQAGKAENDVAVKDAEQAQAALASAISVLSTFYKKSGMVPKEPWEFVQMFGSGVDLPENPSTWDASYTGVADPSKAPDGIITVLKEVTSDFARMEADSRAQEELDTKAYDEEMKRCTIEKARRQKEAEMKLQEQKRLVNKIDSEKKSRKHVSDELEAVVQYSKDLQPACVEGDSTYADRKAARSKEVDALKEAQEILASAFNEKGKSEAAPSFLQRPAQIS